MPFQAIWCVLARIYARPLNMTGFSCIPIGASFKEFVYNAAPSSCFVVGKEQGPVLKPAWGDDLWWTPSRYTIVCETLVAVDRIVPSLDDMCLEDEDFKYTPTIFPKGTTFFFCRLFTFIVLI